MMRAQRRDRHSLGRQAERLASRYLQGQGLRLVERNYRQPFGEIDLVMLDGPTLVFVEIKYRRDQRWMPALECISPMQQRRIARAGARYLQQRGTPCDSCRFDVVVLLGAKPQVQWLQNAFTADLFEADLW